MSPGLTRRAFLACSAGSALLALSACHKLGIGRPKIGLALGGGGAKGLAHIPMLETLDELDIRPYRIAGSSIGAVIGAAYAAGLSATAIRAQVEQFLPDEDDDRLFKLPKSLRWLDFIDPGFGGNGLLDSSDFIEWLGELLPVRNFEELKYPLQVVAADLQSGREVIFRSGALLPAIKASMAVPGVFPPVEIDGHTLVDGGLANPLPYDHLQSDCDIVIAIDASGNTRPPAPDDLSALGVLRHSFGVMSDNLLVERLKHSRPDIYVKPDIRDVRLLEFYKAREVFRQARPAQRWLQQELQRYAQRS